MTKIEELLNMKLTEGSYSFDREWLRDLQKELKTIMRSPDMWSQVDRTKLKDCRKDKAAILAEMKALLERWYERELVFKEYKDEFDNSYIDEEGESK